MAAGGKKAGQRQDYGWKYSRGFEAQTGIFGRPFGVIQVKISQVTNCGRLFILLIITWPYNAFDREPIRRAPRVDSIFYVLSHQEQGANIEKSMVSVGLFSTGRVSLICS